MFGGCAATGRTRCALTVDCDAPPARPASNTSTPATTHARRRTPPMAPSVDDWVWGRCWIFELRGVTSRTPCHRGQSRLGRAGSGRHGAGRPSHSDTSRRVRDFFTGIRMFGQGLVILLRAPRLLVIGELPVLVTGLLLVAGIVALGYWADDLAALLTPFADRWADGLRAAVRFAVAVAVFGAVLVVGLISFTALTVAVGGPFYEHIAEKVEDDLSGPPAQERDLSWWWLLGTGLRDGVVLVLRSLLFTLPLVRSEEHRSGLQS